MFKPTITIYIHTNKNAYALVYMTYTYTSIQFKEVDQIIGFFSNKWANGTKYCALYRTSVGNVLIVELGNRTEFLKNIF